MLSRRELLSGAALGGPPTLMGVEAGQDGQSMQEVARVLEDIRDELEAARTTCSVAVCRPVAELRRHQRVFL